MRIVIALGGNAVSPAGRSGDIPHQFERTRETMRPIADLVRAGHQVILTHGNGPQVGFALRRVEFARGCGVYPLPLDIIGADTQGGMGYMIAQCLMNELAARGAPRACSTIVTTVRVDRDDPAFDRPSKPIGGFLSHEDAQRRAADEGWSVVEDAGRGWRRVVPSPTPREIIELPLIRRLVDAGELLVCGGGGGVPVVRDADGRLSGVEAVVDKDRTSALLASGVEADLLAILTGVEQVQIDYGTPQARPVARAMVAEARAWQATGQFPPGSMGPKIEAAIDFLEHSPKGDPRVLISSCERIADALAGKTGTLIVNG